MKKPDGNTDFENKAKQWDQNPVPVKIAQGVGEAMLRELNLRPDMEVLDFGCGTGLVTLSLQPRVGTITGADSSQAMIGILQEKIKHLGVTNVRTQLVDFEKGGRVEGIFDLIVSSMTLHHVADTETLLKHWHGVLRPGGGRIPLHDPGIRDELTTRITQPGSAGRTGSETCCFHSGQDGNEYFVVPLKN